MVDTLLKPVEWVGSSRRDLQICPDGVRSQIGHALYLVQCGGTPNSAKPLKGELRGVMEIVADDDGDTYRAMYTVVFRGVVYVLHVFQKKSKSGIATPQHELRLVAQRFKVAAQHYAERGAR